MALEAEITPGMTAAEAVELAVAVENAGFDRLGISDVVLWPDCFMLLALSAQATSRVQLGALVTNPYSRPAVMLAGAHATLADISDGRAFCGIGVGAGLEVMGCEYQRPVGMIRDAIGVVRKHAPEMPIAIGTRSPQIMALAGEVADIALIGARYWSASVVETKKGSSTAGMESGGRTGMISKGSTSAGGKSSWKGDSSADGPMGKSPSVTGAGEASVVGAEI